MFNTYMLLLIYNLKLGQPWPEVATLVPGLAVMDVLGWE